MRKGEDIGLKVIKTQVRDGNPALRAVHEKINTVLYPYKYRYVSPMMGQRILNELTELGKTLAATDVPDKVLPKKAEILEQLREVVKRLKIYVKEYTTMTADDIQQVQTTLKYQLACYLKIKDTDELDILKCLAENRMVWTEMYLPCPYRDKINVTEFVKMQNELLSKLSDSYKLR